jgi:hypothetical protein
LRIAEVFSTALRLQGDGSPGDQVYGTRAPVDFETAELPQDGCVDRRRQVGFFFSPQP